MNNYKIEFTKDEITSLLQLIDIAVQSKGLQIAEVAVYFHNKFRQEVVKIDQENDESKLKE